jgi:hypothetical protein
MRLHIFCLSVSQNNTFLTLMFRIFSGIAGGLLGMIFSLIVLFLVSMVQPQTGEISASYSLVSILMLVFTGTMTSNLCVAFLLTLMDSKKYNKRRRMISQVFVLTIILFLLMIPFYLFAADSMVATAGSHLLFSALITSLVCEIVSGRKYTMTGLIGVMFSGSFLIGILSILLNVSEHDSLLLIFALPLAWMFIPAGIFLVEIVENSWKKLYGGSPISLEDTDEMNP